MILFRFLKLFGLDVPGYAAQWQAKLEQRVEAAKQEVKHAIQTAVIVAVLAAVAAIAALAAVGIGLAALYGWVALNYGPFYGLAAVGGALVLTAVIAAAVALLEAKSWTPADAAPPAPMIVETGGADRLEAKAETVGWPARAIEAPPMLPPADAKTSAADLVAPLSLILSRVFKFPTTGNPILDELLFMLRGSAKEAADEAVEGAVQTVRYGHRGKLAAVLGTAAVLGWLMAQYGPQHGRTR